MFILEISRAKLKLHFVSGKETEQTLVEIPWSAGKLTGIFSELSRQYKEKYKFNNVRIVVGDDLSYVLEVLVPKNELIAGVNERQLVFKLASEQIPEILDNDGWDFKEEGETENAKKVRVFAPVKSFLDELKVAAGNAQIKIEAIEPISIARARNPNPILAIAEKADLTGRDEQVLNIVGTEKKEEIKKEEIKIEKRIIKLNRTNRITIIMATVVAIIIVIFVIFFLIKK